MRELASALTPDALILVPTVVAVLLAGIRVVASIDSLTAYQRTRSAAEYSVHLRDLAQATGLERDLFAWAWQQQALRTTSTGRRGHPHQQRAAVDNRCSSR